MYFVYIMLKISTIILLKHVKACPYNKLYQSTHYSALIRVDIRQALLSHSWNMGFSSFLWTKYMGNCEAMTVIHIDCSRNVRWKLRKFKISYLPYFSSDLHQIFTVLLEILTLSIDLKDKLPQAFMVIEWMEDDFRNLTANVWANLENPIKLYDFSKVSLILCMLPSQVALF